MGDRMFISLNWMLGTIGLIVAVVFPLLDGKFLTGMKKVTAEQLVHRIAKAEHELVTTNEKYVLFEAGEMPKEIQSRTAIDVVKENDFVYDAFLEDETLVIRARASGPQVMDGSLPPWTYLYKKTPTGKVTRQWERLSGKKPGLIPGI